MAQGHQGTGCALCPPAKPRKRVSQMGLRPIWAGQDQGPPESGSSLCRCQAWLAQRQAEAHGAGHCSWGVGKEQPWCAGDRLWGQYPDGLCRLLQARGIWPRNKSQVSLLKHAPSTRAAAARACSSPWLLQEVREGQEHLWTQLLLPGANL